MEYNRKEKGIGAKCTYIFIDEPKNKLNLEKILNAAEIKNTSPPPHGAKRPVASIEGSNKIIYGKYNISILLIALIIFIYLVFFLLFIIN